MKFHVRAIETAPTKLAGREHELRGFSAGARAF